MTTRIQITLLFSIAILASFPVVKAQPVNSPMASTEVFHELSDLLTYATEQSITLKNNEIQLDQAKKAKLAAVLGTIDVTGSLLSAQYTDNTQLGVNLFPAEIFGGEPGTFKEVQMGVRYNTNLTNYAEVKLINPVGWSNLKLSKINILMTSSNNQISLKNLQENIAKNYYNIVNLQEQIASAEKSLVISDTLYQITLNKFEEGLVNQQDVNDSQVNYLTSQENIKQLTYLLEQYYISLKLMCDIPAEQPIEINHLVSGVEEEKPLVLLNELSIRNFALQESYAKSAYNSAKAAYIPTLSLQLSNSNNLYNNEFQPLSGDWINSNYIGLRLNVPIPSSKTISNTYSTKFDYQIAQQNTQQARLQATLNQQNLTSEYEQALSQLSTDKKILALRQDAFSKNQQLYEEGLIGLDVTLNSFNSMVNAQYNLNSSEVNVQLIQSNININNTIR